MQLNQAIIYRVAKQTLRVAIASGLTSGMMLSLAPSLSLAQSQSQGQTQSQKPGVTAQNRAKPSRSRTRRRPVPPASGRFVTSRGGGDRTCGSPLARLVPTYLDSESGDETTGSFTTQSHPSFWAHIPYQADELKSLEFELQSDDTFKPVYRARLTQPQRSGLIAMSLPEDAPALVPGTRYSWFVTAEFDCQLKERSNPQIITLDGGWIERYEPDADLSKALQRKTQRYEAYRDNGLWFDALELVGKALQQQPNSAALQVDWEALLELYGLGQWQQEPVQNCCEMTPLPLDGVMMPPAG